MAFPTDDILLGPHAYGLRKGTEMVVLHTTEGAGPTRDHAVATAKAQSPGGGLYAGGGSYNFIIYDSASAGAKGGALLTVPYLESSGGLTANHTPPPGGVWLVSDWVKAALSAAAEADTNAYVIQIAFSGKAAALAAGQYPANMIDTAARLIRWIEQQAWAPDNINVAGHLNFQTNRTDPGAGVVAKVIERYKALYVAPAPIPVPPPDYKALYEAEKTKVAALNAKVTSLNSQVANLTTELRAANARISAAKAALG